MAGWHTAFLHTWRLLPRNTDDDYLYERAPSSFDISHNLTLVGNFRLMQFLSGGLTLR